MNTSESGSSGADTGSAESTTPSGISRRTVVQGAAWSIPVIAVAVGTPLAAASTTPNNTLTFDSPSYTPNAACEIPGVTLTLTDSNSAFVPNEPVIVDLPDGWTFPDGTSTHTGVTDAEGKIALPDIMVGTERGEQVTFRGTTPTADPAVTTAIVTTGPTAYEYNPSDPDGPSTSPKGAVPPNSIAIGGGLFQAPNGDIYDWNSGGTRIVEGADLGAVGYPGNEDGEYYVDYTKDGEAFSRWTAGNTSGGPDLIEYGAVSGVKPVGAGYFWNEATGDLYRGAQLIHSGVSSASGYTGPDGFYYVDFTDADGAKTQSSKPGSGAGSYGYMTGDLTAIGAGFFLGADGKLWSFDQDTPIAEGVTSAVGYPDAKDVAAAGLYWVSYVMDGEVWEAARAAGDRADERTVPRANIPSGAVPVGGGFFLVDGIDLWSWEGGGKLIKSGVTSAIGYESATAAGYYYGDYVVGEDCS